MNAITDQSNQSISGESSASEVIGAVRELISLMSHGGISELDLSTADMTIRLRGNHGVAGGAPVMIPEGSFTTRTTEPEPAGHVVTAPMIGTYYASPSPGEAPFVQIGDEVEVGQVIGIIEAMKIMNEIISDRSGVVAEVMVENAQAVEYGSPLIRLTEQTDAIS
ncbi:MAG TPA: biotin/lipoyl-containing protein [Thermomicrobiales bacterium]|nr:biotin/lipoyl-containing protein [Thermomicrobiales bacterium]